MLRFAVRSLSCCCILIAISTLAAEAEDTDELATALWAEFYAFQARHDLTGSDLLSLIGGMALDGRAIDKGGVGPIRDKINILVSGERNGLSVRGTRWIGKRSSEKEVVYLKSDGTMTTEEEFDASSGIVIFFSPEVIRYVDFTRNTGHRYVRSSDRG